MKSKMLFLVFAIAGFILVTGTAQASLLKDHVDADGVQDTLRDTSRAMFMDLDGSGAGFTAGDVIYGWAAVSGVIPDSGGSYGAQAERIVIVFSAKITSVVGTTISLDYNDLGAAGHDLAHITGGKALHARAGAATDAIAVILSGANPVGAVLPGALSSGAAFGGAAYDYEATVGLVGAEDFFEVDFSGGFAVPSERGGFTVQDASGSYGNGTVFVPVTGIADFTGAVKLPEVGLLGSISGGLDGYDLSDTSDFFINAVPEPASMAVWAAGLLCFAGASLRRRKK